MRRRTCHVVAALILALSALGPPARAVEPDEILKDPQLESRARKISAELRCLVCQNQSIDDSNAPLARDLRLIVRERLTAGDTNRQVMDFVVARYGEFVLLRPPLGLSTVLLWVAPLLALLAASLLLARAAFNRRPAAETDAVSGLSEAEEAELKRILAQQPHAPAANEKINGS